MILLCERCGSIIELDDIYIVVFRGRLTGKHAQHIACGKCAREVDRVFHDVFSSELIEECVSMNRIEVKDV